MPMSEFYRAIRERVGTTLLLMPAVAAVIRDGEGRILLQQQHDDTWSLPAGAVEPGESPGAAVAREVVEETGLVVRAEMILAVLGGEQCRVRYPNHDEVEYVVTVFACAVLGGALITSCISPPPKCQSSISHSRRRSSSRVARQHSSPIQRSRSNVARRPCRLLERRRRSVLRAAFRTLSAHFEDAGGASSLGSGLTLAAGVAEVAGAPELAGAPEPDGAAEPDVLGVGSGMPFFIHSTRPKRGARWKLPWPRIGDQATPPLFFMA